MNAKILLRRALPLLASAALLGAACGGSDDESSADADATTEVPSSEPTQGSDTTSPTEPVTSDTSAADEEGEEPADGGGALDPCSLLTPADLEAAIGSPYEPGESTATDIGTVQCIWSNTDVPPVKLVSLAMARTDLMAGPMEGISVPELFADTKEFAEDPIDLDLGDESYMSGATVYVLQGETSFELSGVLATSDEAKADILELAELVLSRA